MKLTLEISETQAYILRDALDAYARLLSGQVTIAVMDAADWFYSHQKDADTVGLRREKLRMQLESMQSLITGLDYGVSFGVTAPEVPDRARQAYDLLQVIRHEVVWYLHPKPDRAFRPVDYDDPRRTSEKEELPKCQVEK